MTDNSGQNASVGNTLRAAREQLGLSVSDVANRIKFATRQIEALEADDYVRLPEPAFVRGFVRSYARLLELDTARLLAALPASHTQPSSTQEMRSVEIPMPSALSARRHNIIWLAAALVIAVSLALFERLHESLPEAVEPMANTKVEQINLPNAVAENETAQAQEQATEPAVVQHKTMNVAQAKAPQQTTHAEQSPAAEVTPTPAKPTVHVTPKAVVTLAASSVSAAPAKQNLQPPAEPKPVKTAPLPWQPVPGFAVTGDAPAVSSAGQPSANADTDAPEHALRMEFDEDAWVEIKDGTEKVLVSRMHTAGSLVRLTGKAPLLVTIGNAQAVRLFDNGKQIKLGRINSSGVARIKLN